MYDVLSAVSGAQVTPLHQSWGTVTCNTGGSFSKNHDHTVDSQTSAYVISPSGASQKFTGYFRETGYYQA